MIKYCTVLIPTDSISKAMQYQLGIEAEGTYSLDELLMHERDKGYMHARIFDDYIELICPDKLIRRMRNANGEFIYDEQ